MAELKIPGVSQQIQLIARLRWMLFKNSLRNIKGRLEALSSAILWLMMSGLVFGGGIFFGIATYYLVHSNHTSWIAGLLCEQLILHGYCVCVIDPEGDYRALEALPGVAVLGGEDPPPTPRDLLRALRYPDRSVVIDLSHVPHDEKIEYIRAVLPALNVMRRRTGLPHRIVLDEAHYFLHDAKAHHLLDLETNGYIVATYCASRLPAELLAGTEVMIVTCE